MQDASGNSVQSNDGPLTVRLYRVAPQKTEQSIF